MAFFDDIVQAAKAGATNVVGVPDTSTRTTYGFTLHLALWGKVPRLVGGLQSVDFTQAQQIDEEYEVDVNGQGLPAELIPQNLTTRTIQVRRFDTYRQILEDVLGPDGEIMTLLDITTPLVIRENWKEPGDIFSISTRAYQYDGVRVQTYNRNVSAVGDRISVTGLTMTWRNRWRII